MPPRTTIRGLIPCLVRRHLPIAFMILVLGVPAAAAPPPPAVPPDTKIEIITSSSGPRGLTEGERAKLELLRRRMTGRKGPGAGTDHVAAEAGLAPPVPALELLPAPRWDAGPAAGLASPAESAALICTYQPMPDDFITGLNFTPAYFSFDQNVVYWNVVGVKSNLVSDWDLGVWDATAPDPDCVATLLATSNRFTGMDFVVGDYNHNPLGTDYARVSRFSGADIGTVMYEAGADILPVNELRFVSASFPRIQIWDIFLEAGSAYTFFLDMRPEDVTDLRLFLFHNPAAAPYWAGRNARVHEQGLEYGSYSTGPADWYGLVVEDETGAGGVYGIRVKDCSGPLPLAHGGGVLTQNPGDVYGLTQGAGVWAGVGVAGGPNTWAAQIYQPGIGVPWPACWGPLITEDVGTSTRLVLGDFRVNPPGTYHPGAVKQVLGGVGNAYIEWDDGRNSIVVDGPPVAQTYGESDVFDLWNVELTAGVEYTLDFQPAGPASITLLLFGNPGVSPYWPQRGNRILETTTATTFTPGASGSYALVAVKDDFLVGSYSLAVRTDQTAIVPAGSAVPPMTRLRAVTPIPMRNDLRIDFDLSEPAPVTFSIVDVSGRSVVELPVETRPAGTWSERWTGRDGSGRRVPAGAYWIRMSVAGRGEVGRQKIIVIK